MLSFGIPAEPGPASLSCPLMPATAVPKPTPEPQGLVGSWAPEILRRRPDTVIIASAAILALFIRLATLVATGHLNGVFEYDDGVYFGSAVRLVHGAVPYRDFVLVQPPGVPLLLSPIALLSYPLGTGVAIEVARVAVTLISVTNVLLLGRLLRHRGPLAVAVGCLVLALFPDAILASSAVLLEPFLNLCCLLGLLAAFEGDRVSSRAGRLLLAGIALGAGGTVKVWAVIPLAVLVVVLLGRGRLRAAGVVVGGAAVGFLGPCLPFLVMAPGAFVHQVVLAQLGRAAGASLPVIYRIEYMTGVWPAVSPSGSRLVELLAIAAAAGVVLTVALAFGVHPFRRWRHPRLGPIGTDLEWVAVVSAPAVGLAFCWPADFFYHYPAFLAPFLGLLLGIAAGRLVGVRPRGALLLVAAVSALALAEAVAIPVLTQRSPDPAAVLDRVIPRGACVVANEVDYTLLANRFTASGPGCPQVVDALGTTMSISGDPDPSTARAQRAAPTWMEMFQRAQFLVLSPTNALQIPWDRGLEAYLERNFTALLAAPALVLERTAPRPQPLSLPLPPLPPSP